MIELRWIYRDVMVPSTLTSGTLYTKEKVLQMRQQYDASAYATCGWLLGHQPNIQWSDWADVPTLEPK